MISGCYGQIGQAPQSPIGQARWRSQWSWTGVFGATLIAGPFKNRPFYVIGKASRAMVRFIFWSIRTFSIN